MAGKLGRKHTRDNPPAWLAEGRDISHTSVTNRKAYERSLRYYRCRLNATGPWTNHDKIAAIYKECDRRRKKGENVVVDHIVPLVSNIVCGLESHHNMEIISELDNAQKGNKYWPDCPNEIGGVPSQDDLFEEIDPVKGQLILII